MAIDEAVWLGRRAGASPPTIRFFAWAPPTVSLDYGQPLDHHVDVAGCRSVGVGIVRRLTDGSAIYHDGPERELTYSVAAVPDDRRSARQLDAARDRARSPTQVRRRGGGTRGCVRA